MPEWNLVNRFIRRPMLLNLRPLLMIGMAFCVFLGTQSGCSRLNSNSLTDLMDQQPDLMEWTKNPAELEKSFLDDPDAFEQLTADNAVSEGEAEFWTPPQNIEFSDPESESEREPASEPQDGCAETESCQLRDGLRM